MIHFSYFKIIKKISITIVSPISLRTISLEIIKRGVWFTKLLHQSTSMNRVKTSQLILAIENYKLLRYNFLLLINSIMLYIPCIRSSLVEGDDGHKLTQSASCCIYEMSKQFMNHKTKFVTQLGQCKPSSPSAKENHSCLRTTNF